MPEGAYSAGSIFLQVVPVFRDLVHDIQREAKKANRALSDEMDKAGREAGKKASEGIGEELNKDADKTGKETGKRVGGAFEREWKAAVKRSRKAFDDDFNAIPAKFKDIARELDKLGDAHIGVDLDQGEAMAKLAAVRAALGDLNGQTAHANVDLDALAAAAELEAFDEKMRRLNGQTAHVNVKVDGAHKAAQDMDNTGNSFRAFNALILAGVTLLPALIPILGAVGGAILALGPALTGVGAGLGVMLLGFSGLGDAVKALGNQHKTAAKDAETAAKTMRSSARQVADAETSLANARRSAAQSSADAERSLAQAKQSAARSNADAARSVAQAEQQAARSTQQALRQRATAERSLASAQRDAKQAQDDLRQARRDAQADLQDARNNLTQNKLDERQGLIDVFNATVNNNNVRSDGSSTNLDKEQAALELANARLRLKEIRERRAELAKQVKEGVNGSDRVKQAQDSLTNALEQQKAAQLAVGDASREVNQARVDGARSVADAIRKQQQTESDGAQRVADAQRAVERAHSDGARSVQTAQQGLLRAQQDYRTSLHDTAVTGSASMQAVDDAMSKLGPTGRKFARFLFSLRGYFYQIRDAAQKGMLPGVQSAITAIVSGKNGARLVRFVAVMGRTIGGLFRDLGRMLTNPLWDDFFGMISRLAPKFTQIFGRMAMNYMSVFARLMTIAAPWALKLSEALLGISQHALDFVKSKRGTDIIMKFLAYAASVAPAVWGFFKNLWAAALNLAIALAPLGGMILGAVDGLLKLVAAIPPKTLGAIVTGILVLVTAFQVLQGVLALASAGMTLFLAVMSPVLGPILLVVGGIVLLAGLLVILYNRSDKAKKIINTAFSAIGKIGQWVFRRILVPAFHYTVAAWTILFKIFQWAWKHVLSPVFHAVANVATWLWRNVLRPTFGFMSKAWHVLAAYFSWVWKHITWPMLNLFGHVVAFGLWRGVLKPTFSLIRTAWHALATAWQWAWKNLIKPVIDRFGDLMGSLWKKVQAGAKKIGQAWTAIKKAFTDPINWVIRTVFNNGLIKGFNKVAKFVHSSPMPTISTIGGGTGRAQSSGQARNDIGAATGAVLPGYTPGRDVHHFSSPTAGNLHLSGGEAIMVPEWTKAVGKKTVAYWNWLARRKGPRAVANALAGVEKFQAFKSGGVFMDGKRISSIAARQIGLAEKIGHINLRIMQGGYGGSHIAASGSSHNYPGVADISPGSKFVEKLLRRVGFAAWARNIAGRSSVGSGAHVHAVSLLDPGDRNSPQVYGSWAHHGNGLSGYNNDPAPHYPLIAGLGKKLGGLDLGSILKNIGGGIAGLVRTIFHLPGWAAKLVKKPLDWAKGLVKKPIEGLADKFGNAAENPLIGFLGHTASKILGGVGSKAKSMLNVFKAAKQKAMDAAGMVGDALGGGAGKISGPVKTVVRQVANTYGWGQGGEWSALANIIMSESGWNPNAANPSSSARGLFQKMTSIHGPLEKTVQGQALWGLNYIKSRFGDPLKAWAFHKSHGWYRDGGVVGDGGSDTPGGIPDNGTRLYDSGGTLPPGLTTVLNLTGKNEHIYTHEQNRALAGGAGQGTVYHYEPTFVGTNLTANDIAADMNHGFRRLENSGKYGRRG